jgi:hypothetical protein
VRGTTEMASILKEPIRHSHRSEFAEQFKVSGFEIYNTRAIVEIDKDYVDTLAHDIKARLATIETLDQIRDSLFWFSNLLDSNEKYGLLKSKKEELADFSGAFIRQSLED